jgi:hypothetical protein
MKKTLLSQVIDGIKDGIMYSASKVKETRDNLIKSKKYSFKLKKKLSRSKQDLIDKYQDNIDESSELINSHQKTITEFLARNRSK